MPSRQSSPFRFRPRPYGRIALATLCIALLSWKLWDESGLPAPEVLVEGDYGVKETRAGNLLLLTNGATVRLIGIELTDAEPQNAQRFTTKFVAGRQVRLQFDRERIDREHRFLAYVWVEDRLLNEELVRAGFATADPGFHYSATMKTRFRRAQQQARQEAAGASSSG